MTVNDWADAWLSQCKPYEPGERPSTGPKWPAAFRTGCNDNHEDLAMATNFTVILLKPGHLNETGAEAFVWQEATFCSKTAVKWAREAACEAHGLPASESDTFKLVAVMSGHPQFLRVDESLEGAN